MRTAWSICLLAAGASACGGLSTPARPGPDPGVLVPQLFDPTDLYRDMGFLAGADQVPFVASVHFLAGPPPDTLFAVVGVSLSSSALSFRKAGRYFEARYRADVAFSQPGADNDVASSTETVRVGSFGETLRADESVIFQQIGRVQPGSLTVRVSVRDLYGDRLGRDERVLQVQVPASGLAAPVAVYRAVPRERAAELPRLLINPRATTPFGMDTLRFYLETYGARDSVTVVALGDRGETFWQRRVPLAGSGVIRGAVVDIAPDQLPVGRMVLVVADRDETAHAPALVSFSDQWTITNFDDVLSLLRYFGGREALREMARAPMERRAELWREFWRHTDPNPVTPRNEALEEYFRRVQTASMQFQEAGDPGWLTDRGEVYITLGEADDVFDQRASLQGARRVIRWVYVRERLALDFVDQTGFGRFRLTPVSRGEFERVAARRRAPDRPETG